MRALTAGVPLSASQSPPPAQSCQLRHSWFLGLSGYCNGSGAREIVCFVFVFMVVSFLGLRRRLPQREALAVRFPGRWVLLGLCTAVAGSRGRARRFRRALARVGRAFAAAVAGAGV